MAASLNPEGRKSLLGLPSTYLQKGSEGHEIKFAKVVFDLAFSEWELFYFQSMKRRLD